MGRKIGASNKPALTRIMKLLPDLTEAELLAVKKNCSVQIEIKKEIADSQNEYENSNKKIKGGK